MIIERLSKIRRYLITLMVLQINIVSIKAQQVYFVDGYHGGVYGHYPKQYTAFINETLAKNPNWKINLEIEPETWDSVQLNEPDNYNTFKKNFSDQSFSGRLEYVNPAYGQSYLYNINGESIIRQFYYGIKKMREHFPEVVFTSYSSEEPCFTSALPQILKSFGFSYASLKNPNTCWGGYTRAFGGELVNWVGPDGTKLITVPRYAVEDLQKGSTWQTTASTNSTAYLQASFNNGIANPVGMCLQDAGWRNGPWLGRKEPVYKTTYVTWRDYIKNIAGEKATQDWNFSQEDVLTSLVWGSQVLQKIAKQVRVSENKIGTAEKITAMARIYSHTAWPTKAFDEAWRGLLLSQHHDCWIVPYNGRKGNTWIDKVGVWTGTADSIAGSNINQAMNALSPEKKSGNHYQVRVFNSNAFERTEWVKATLPNNLDLFNFKVLDERAISLPSQIIREAGKSFIIFKAKVPAVGYTSFNLQKTTADKGVSNSHHQAGMYVYVIETDLYKISINLLKGGIIKSIYAKKMDREFVDQTSDKYFNELRGFFFKDSSYFSSTQNPATINIIEEGAAGTTLAIHGTINQQHFTQTLTVRNGEPVIGLKINIDWTGNPGIGNAYKQKNGYRGEDYTKAFYDDSAKLQTLFPVNIRHQKIYKNAPFDVTESKLSNTFFGSWDSIKNNILLNWVDVTDVAGKYGLALFCDHTTNYSHGENYPLALTTQYSGVGLWGRNYSIAGPTIFNYAILPHEGKWDEANIWNQNTAWNNPMQSIVFANATDEIEKKSLISTNTAGLEVTAVLIEGGDLLVRFFNSTKEVSHEISFDGIASAIELIELNGDVKQIIKPTIKTKRSFVILAIPQFGVRTIRLKDFKAVK